MLRKTISELLYPERIKCIVCNNELCGLEKNYICEKCKLRFNNEHFCKTCGRPLGNLSDYCLECKSRSWNFELARSAFYYEDSVKSLILGYKFNSKRYLSKYLSVFLTELYKKESFNADIITFVPLHKKRLKARGYNQAQLLAECVAQDLSLPVIPLLIKTKHTKNMAKLDATKRRDFIKDSFAENPQAFDKLSKMGFSGFSDIKNKNVLLIDDVFTTGATANECSLELNKLKCGKIFVMTLASKP